MSFGKPRKRQLINAVNYVKIMGLRSWRKMARDRDA